MMKKLVIVFILFVSPFGFFLQAQDDIFDQNIFSGIDPSPEFYKTDRRFSIVENVPDIAGYAWRSNADLESVAENESIEINYWRINGIYRIQLVRIFGNTDCSIWAKYIGKGKEEVLNLYKSYQSLNNREIVYVSNDWEYFIRFELLNEKIVAITFGRNI
jgi:hypothetical protein